MPVMQRRSLALCGIALLLLLGLAACSEASANLGRYVRGRTLDLTVVAVERVPELRYSTVDPQQVTRHFRMVPSQEGMELVLLRVKVENHTATSAIVNVEPELVELRDFLRGTYFPVNVAPQSEGGRMEEVEVPPPSRGGWSVKVIEINATGGTAPGQGFIHGAFELRKNMGVDGWLVFEAPKGTKFRELKWRAGDSVTFTF